MKIRGKLESGLAVKTVSITASVDDIGLGKEMAFRGLLVRAIECFYDTGTKNTRDEYNGKFLDDNFLTMLSGKTVIIRQRRR